MRKTITITISVIFPSGALELSAMIDGYRCHKVYYGYTRKEAKAEFLAEFMPS